MEVYVDDMIMNTTEGHKHLEYLEDVLQSVKKYNMCLNPAKCSFGVQAKKFLGFILMKRGIEANSDKWKEFIAMRSVINIKEVKKLTGCLTTISCFLSCAVDKDFLFFDALKKK